MPDRSTAPEGVTLPLNLGLNDGTYAPSACLEVMRRYTERTDFRNYGTPDNDPLREAIASMGIYILMGLVLVWRPTGLFGARA